MPLNNVVVKTLDARGQLAILWLSCPNNVTLNKLLNLSKPWQFGHKAEIITVST